MHSSNFDTARALALRVREAGGTAYYVGGYVRDTLLGTPSKDLDLEIHGITPEALEDILRSLGTVRTVGESFGIYSLSHCDLDISLPRREGCRGGKAALADAVDPFLGPKEAARRRDFTINAMLQDVLTGEILDFFGGRRDLSDGILRHTDSGTFPEDPLRVLRAAQLSARLGFTIAPETQLLCSTLPLGDLARERVFGELSKALLKAEKPSVFFEALREMHQLEPWFPELLPLIGLEQDPRWHPEGDAFTHTLLVLDAAASLKTAAEYPLGFLLAALCHDFGKPQTTTREGGRIRSINHERAGLPLTSAFLKRLTNEDKLRRYVLNLVENHMRPNLLAAQQSSKKATNRMFDESVSPSDLLLLAKADCLGQLHGEGYAPTEAFLRERLETYRQLMALPQVTGKDLIEAGMSPGPAFSAALAHAHKLQLSGNTREQALKATLSIDWSKKNA